MKAVSQQLTFDFAPGLLEQYPDFMDCVRAAVYGCGRPLKIIAADCDMSESGLSRRLANNPDDQVHFPMRKLPALIEATHDTRPVQWLVLTFLQDADQRQRSALQQIATLAPILQNLLLQAGATEAPPPAKGKR
jgi:hypothetical protein